MPEFKAETVELSGSNLIEASAGTGKTYSIAILVLRLVMQGIPVREILMVTFTKAAVAELESRIRLFLRRAELSSNGKDCGDGNIQALVEKEFQEHPDSITAIRQRIHNAVLSMDETAISTIHSFCQQALNEFSFETGQVFGASALAEFEGKAIQQQLVNKFWREEVTILDPVILSQLEEFEFNRDTITEAVRYTVAGKKIYNQTNIPGTTSEQENLDTITRLRTELSTMEATIKEYFRDNELAIREKFSQLTQKNQEGIKKGYFQLDPFNVDQLFSVSYSVIKNKKPAYVLNFFTELEPDMNRYLQAVDQLNKQVPFLIYTLCRKASIAISNLYEERKKQLNVVSFDDMISSMHTALCDPEKGNPVLVRALQQKYKAVFVDEFQDTDKLQFEIFETLYGRDSGSGTILFYIGDPKQSIYGFRKADINTYLTAGTKVNTVLTMNTNFRSSRPVLKALNHFFRPKENFDTFLTNTVYRDEQDTEVIIPGGIQYYPVDVPEGGASEAVFMFDDKPHDPLIIHTAKDNEAIIENAIATVMMLLNDHRYTVPGRDGVNRPVKPSDIGILVRKNKEAMKIRKALSLLRIPCITVDSTKIMQTETALDMLYLLDAVNSGDIKAINRALVTEIAGYHFSDLNQFDEQLLTEQFRMYKANWKEKGLYSMLQQLINDHGLRVRLTNPTTKNGDRILSNLYQLIDLLHRTESDRNFSPLELLNWLKAGVEVGDDEGDEYELRLESDEDAVQIVTIHKCKGLEYNIVVAPFLDMTTYQNFPFLTFRNPIDEGYYFINKECANDEVKKWNRRENDQENRRLLYVALTRTKYVCFINWHTHSFHAGSALRPFINELKGVTNKKDNKKENPEPPPVININGIRETDPPQFDQAFIFNSTNRETALYSTADKLPLTQLNWAKHSYSYLGPKHGPWQRSVYAAVTSQTEYDRFVFDELQKGAGTGNFLHAVFEQIDFTDDQNWKEEINKALKRYPISKGPNFTNRVEELIRQVLSLRIPVEGELTESLSDIANDYKLNELEFDFPLRPFMLQQFTSLDQFGIPVKVKEAGELEGIMNGKIDLIFEHAGKFYILDWKSNFLGNRVEDYDNASVARAMEENNYHLQYMIYTVALCRYLALRKPGFDYDSDFGGIVYVFLRGVRQGQQQGCYFFKPSKAAVEHFSGIMEGKLMNTLAK